MNFSGSSRNSSSSKNNLQQKQLEYFGITSSFVQGKGKEKDTTSSYTVIPNENSSAKRTHDESIEVKIADILQEFEGLSGQALLKKILEDKSYTLYNDNRHVYCQICQKPIALHRPNDGTRLKEHIITPTHIEKFQKMIQETESKRLHSTFLTSFFNKTNNNYNIQADNIDLIEPVEEPVEEPIEEFEQVEESQKLLEMAFKNSEKHGIKYYLFYFSSCIYLYEFNIKILHYLYY